MTLRAAATRSLLYIVIALLFGLILALAAGPELAGEYVAGYVVERCLSIDNLFVFVVIFATYGVRPAEQTRRLGQGIALALVLRVGFIVGGAALIETFRVTFLAFGGILLLTAIRLLRHRGQAPRVTRRRLPVVVVLAATDLLFALDSIPAVYGVTDEVLIVLAANAFALLGLRPLFFAVAGLLERLVHLQSGLAVVLAFIGAKLILHFARIELPTALSLGVILAILGLTTFASLRSSPPRDREIHARPHTPASVRPRS